MVWYGMYDTIPKDTKVKGTGRLASWFMNHDHSTTLSVPSEHMSLVGTSRLRCISCDLWLTTWHPCSFLLQQYYSFRLERNKELSRETQRVVISQTSFLCSKVNHKDTNSPRNGWRKAVWPGWAVGNPFSKSTPGLRNCRYVHCAHNMPPWRQEGWTAYAYDDGATYNDVH